MNLAKLTSGAIQHGVPTKVCRFLSSLVAAPCPKRGQQTLLSFCFSLVKQQDVWEDWMLLLFSLRVQLVPFSWGFGSLDVTCQEFLDVWEFFGGTHSKVDLAPFQDKIEHPKLHWWFYLDVHHKNEVTNGLTLHQLKGIHNSSVWPCSFWVIPHNLDPMHCFFSLITSSSNHLEIWDPFAPIPRSIISKPPKWSSNTEVWEKYLMAPKQWGKVGPWGYPPTVPKITRKK